MGIAVGIWFTIVKELLTATSSVRRASRYNLTTKFLSPSTPAVVTDVVILNAPIQEAFSVTLPEVRAKSREAVDWCVTCQYSVAFDMLDGAPTDILNCPPSITDVGDPTMLYEPVVGGSVGAGVISVRVIVPVLSNKSVLVGSAYKFTVNDLSPV